MTVAIRPMSAADVAGVAALTRQLGYGATAGDIADRYKAARAVPGSVVLVAEDNGHLVGWIHVLDRLLLQADRALEIGGLVVDEDRRGEGIGAALVDAVTELARRNGHATLFVRSNVVREGAHDFYPALGFAHHKTSHTYVMELG